MITYYAFHRTWWKRVRGGMFHQQTRIIPCLGRRTILGHHLSYDEARQICEFYNRNHKPGILSRRAEFTEET